jgi:RNA polymerase sigma factor (sigma-70 family)
VATRKAVRLAGHRSREAEMHRKMDLPPQPPLPDEALSDLESLARLQLALAQLEPRCRELLQAVFLDPSESSYRDIARRLGIPVNSLGPTRSRCLAKLRKIMNSME